MKTVNSNQLSVISLKIIKPILIVISLIVTIGTASAELTAKANHDHIKVDFFYHGSTVSVSGIADKGTDLIIKIASPEGHEALKQKGKVGGLLWMNVGALNFEDVPNLYSIHSTRKVEDLIDQNEQDRFVIGYPALGRHVQLSPAADEQEKAKWFGEFLKYKESSRLYTTSAGRIDLKEKDGKQSYYINTEWPYQAPPGDYLVTVYAVKDGKIVDTAVSKVLVEQVGIVKTLAGMAKNNASIYGIISILSALGAGFGVGLVFRKGGGAH
ncbi:MAG: TIGR02186 family protein [Nitrospirae bacterium]|nr:TIGR02186 family protein [Nitrospirota bacterium]